MHVIFAGVAGIAMLAFVAHPDVAETAPGQVRLTSIDSPLPQRPVAGGFATDDSDDEAQLQQQLAQQQLLISEQQAEQQNEAAEQQFEQDMQQAQLTEQQANNP